MGEAKFSIGIDLGTTHCALADVSKRVTPERLHRVFDVTLDALMALGIGHGDHVDLGEALGEGRFRRGEGRMQQLAPSNWWQQTRRLRPLAQPGWPIG